MAVTSIIFTISIIFMIGFGFVFFKYGYNMFKNKKGFLYSAGSGPLFTLKGPIAVLAGIMAMFIGIFFLFASLFSLLHFILKVI